MSGFRILVTGSRFALWDQHEAKIRETLEAAQQQENVTLVHGAADGVDKIAARIGADLGWTIEPHPAKWKQHGKAAGPLRNIQMVDLGADVMLAFPMYGELNKGTLGCAEYGRSVGMRQYVFWLEAMAK